MDDFHALPAVGPLLFFAFVMFTACVLTMAFAVSRIARMTRTETGCWPPFPLSVVSGLLAATQARDQATDQMRPSGNPSFDAYRSNVLARLDEEARAFAAFRESRRSARDREAFASFLDARAGHSSAATPSGDR